MGASSERSINFFSSQSVKNSPSAFDLIRFDSRKTNFALSQDPRTLETLWTEDSVADGLVARDQVVVSQLSDSRESLEQVWVIPVEDV
jgi:hypothetical protein